MPIIHGTASWPGAISVASCKYTLSKGITPGCAMLKINPQNTAPALFGDLSISDGAVTLTLNGCKVVNIRSEIGPDGQSWYLEILDTRWTWIEGCTVTGCYNQLDPLGKLIPWTIRSPSELAALCLEAVGATPGTVDLPPGLTKKQGIMFGNVNPVHLGVNPITGTNPPINWEHEPAANALAALGRQFGREVVYRISDGRVSLLVNGQGGDLPNGSIASESPSLHPTQTPPGIGISGAPTRYQVRLLMEAVGREWDRSFRAIDRLSYAPLSDALPQIIEATVVDPSPPADEIYVAVFGVFRAQIGNPNPRPVTDVDLTFTYTTLPGGTANDVVTNIVNQINNSNDPRAAELSASVTGAGVMRVEGTVDGHLVSFDFYQGSANDGGGFPAFVAQPAVEQRPSWRFVDTDTFWQVQETDRLTHMDAIRLAQESVFRCYRVSDVDVRGSGRIKIPNYGLLKRRQQMILEATQVEQIVPEQGDNVALNQDGLPVTVDLYNGYSRDKPSVCYGQTMDNLQRFFHAGERNVNTPVGSRIFMDFSTDPYEQVITFSSMVYYAMGGGGISPPPRLVLQTAVSVRNPNTNALETYITAKRLGSASANRDFAGDGEGVGLGEGLARRYPGISKFAFQNHRDVQLNIIGIYNPGDRLAGARVLEADAIMRSKYYLAGFEAQFFTQGAQTRKYNGIMPIDLDGAISQVTWEVGSDGAMTTASKNTEHDKWIAPARARRREEFLPAVRIEEAVNYQRVNVMQNPWLQGPSSSMLNPWIVLR